VEVIVQWKSAVAGGSPGRDVAEMKGRGMLRGHIDEKASMFVVRREE